MLKRLLKEYGTLVGVLVMLVSYWTNSALAEGASTTKLALLEKEQASMEVRVDTQTNNLNSLITLSSIHTEQLKQTQSVQEKQTAVLEDIAKVQQQLQITLVGVQAELKASREYREGR